MRIVFFSDIAIFEFRWFWMYPTNFPPHSSVISMN